MSSRRGDRFKQAFDDVVGGALFVVSLPVQACVAIARRSMGPPVLFWQPRPSRDGRVFELVKCRSMRYPDSLRSDGVKEQGQATSGPFRGSTTDPKAA